MQSKQLLFKQEMRERLRNGVEKIATAVAATMGPKGRVVLIERPFGSPQVTKDGVTVAKGVSVKDKFENMGVELVKEASSKTNDLAGDGTTATCVLAQAIYREAQKVIGAGADPTEVKSGIDEAVGKVVEELGKQAVPVKDKETLVRVASISANDPEIGRVVAEVMHDIGPEGVVTVEQSEGLGIKIEKVQGLQVDSGFLSPYFITNPEKMEAVIENAYILVTDRKVLLTNEVMAVMKRVIDAGGSNLVVIAETVEGAALSTLVVNKVQGRFQALAVKSPGFGDRRREILEDVCAVTGATLVSEELGRKVADVTVEMLGRANRVIATKDKTVIVEGQGSSEAVNERIAYLDRQIELAEENYDKERIKERKAKIKGGVGIFKVGAATESELQEKRQRVEDAIFAAKGALLEGIVPGGGVALATISSRDAIFYEEGTTRDAGIEALRNALTAPLKQIAENAGVSGEVVLAECRRTGLGYNAARGAYGDLVDEGVIDPTLVIRLALQHGASVANLLISAECAIVEEVEEKHKHD